VRACAAIHQSLCGERTATCYQNTLCLCDNQTGFARYREKRIKRRKKEIIFFCWLGGFMKIQQETAKAVCETCGKEFDRPIFRFGEKEIFRQRECPECSSCREQMAPVSENQERLRAIKESWQRICPPRYRDFNRSLSPVPDELIDQVLNWRPKKSPSYDPNSVRIFPKGTKLPMTDETCAQILTSRPSPSADGRGLCLVGPPHVGKRHLLYALRENLFHAGFQIAAISGPEFDAIAPLRTDRESGASVRKRLNQLRSSQILILTDVGAEKLPESAQREFYNLIEGRAQHFLPILWSTQFSREEVAARFVSSNGPEIALARGRAAVDRLNKLSDVIELEWKSTRLPDSSRTVLARA